MTDSPDDLLARAEARAGEMEHRYDQLTLAVGQITAERDEARAEIARLTAGLDALREALR
jgi:hypothetical protein